MTPRTEDLPESIARDRLAEEDDAFSLTITTSSSSVSLEAATFSFLLASYDTITISDDDIFGSLCLTLQTESGVYVRVFLLAISFYFF